MIFFTLTAIAALVGSLVVEQVQCARTVKKCNHITNTTQRIQADESVVNGFPPHCFPAVGFKMPNAIPTSLTNWWCNMDTEYAFVGFNYDISLCPSLTQLKTDFLNMKNTFNARYVRLWEACDNKGFYDDVIEAAWNAGIGVHALIWFEYTGSNQWKARCDTLLDILHPNPKAKFVTRLVQVGSEPLFDSILALSILGDQVAAVTKNLSSLQIEVDISELAYGWQKSKSKGSLQIMGQMGSMMAPFDDAKILFVVHIADLAWPLVLSNIDWFQKNAPDKKLLLDENGWPSATSHGVQPVSPFAVANIQNEQKYFALLDKYCQYFKDKLIGWFAHSYKDQIVEGYGIYDLNGAPKFPFGPRISC